jgi:hypothetical protein
MSHPITPRITSFVLAALVTGGLLGSIKLIAAEQVAAARLASQQSQHPHPAAQLAARVACLSQS